MKDRSKTETLETMNHRFEDYVSYGFESVPSRVEYKLFAHEKEATCVTFNSTGNLLLTGGGDSLIKIWDLHRACEY
jgi:WD40 repeat protein